MSNTKCPPDFIFGRLLLLYMTTKTVERILMKLFDGRAIRWFFLRVPSGRNPLKSLYGQTVDLRRSWVGLNQNRWCSKLRGSCAGNRWSVSSEIIPRQRFWTLQSDLAWLRGLKDPRQLIIKINKKIPNQVKYDVLAAYWHGNILSNDKHTNF